MGCLIFVTQSFIGRTAVGDPSLGTSFYLHVNIIRHLHPYSEINVFADFITHMILISDLPQVNHVANLNAIPFQPPKKPAKLLYHNGKTNFSS